MDNGSVRQSFFWYKHREGFHFFSSASAKVTSYQEEMARAHNARTVLVAAATMVAIASVVIVAYKVFVVGRGGKH